MADRPSEHDRVEALTTVLRGVQRGDDARTLTGSIRHLHPDQNTFPGEVFMALGADALTLSGATADNPIALEDLAKTFLPELELARGETNILQTAILFSASLSAGLEPDLLQHVAWWRTDDYWTYATWAAIALIRASAQHQNIAVTDVVHHLAQRHNITIA